MPGRLFASPKVPGWHTDGPHAHISWMEKLIALTFVVVIVAFAAAYTLSAWKGRHL
jgi:hypothetical protein